MLDYKMTIDFLFFLLKINGYFLKKNLVNNEREEERYGKVWIRKREVRVKFFQEKYINFFSSLFIKTRLKAVERKRKEKQ